GQIGDAVVGRDVPSRDGEKLREMNKASRLEKSGLERLNDQALPPRPGEVSSLVQVVDRFARARVFNRALASQVLWSRGKPHRRPACVDRWVVIRGIARREAGRYVDIDSTNGVDHLPKSLEIEPQGVPNRNAQQA